MLEIRRADERGLANLGWLTSYHTFSFGHYYDPRHMGFGPLRVINEDYIQPGKGFETHGHRDMEIITYVLSGALEHRDSMGNGSVIRPGEVQRMTAGTGVMHSEFNNSDTDLLHLLQIWILPERAGLTPGYEEKAFGDEIGSGKLLLIGSRDGRAGSVTIHRDVDLYAALLPKGETVTQELHTGRKAWLQVARGAVGIGDQQLAAGDCAAIDNTGELAMTGLQNSELLLFDM